MKHAIRALDRVLRRIDHRHIQLVPVILSLILVVLGGGAPTDGSAGGG